MNDKKQRLREYEKKRSRDKKVIPSLIYSIQKSSSKKRSHPSPSYTLEWLKNWMLSNPEYHRLHDIWVISGYDSKYKPTVDRLDDSIGYTEYNIQLLDWQSNRAKGHKERQKGGDTAQGRLCKKILQFNMNGVLVRGYKSITEAHRITNINRANIQACAMRKRNRAGKYIWRFKDDYDSSK